jgi:hypothetical protein
MARYYFDIREGDHLSRDEEGMEFTSLAAVQAEAARSLAAMAKDAIDEAPHIISYRKTVEVRDDVGSVLQVRFTFDFVAR